MDMNDFKPNSNKYKEEHPRERRLVKSEKGRAEIHKKNFVEKLSEVFIVGSMSEMSDYVFFEVIVPAIKNTISEVIFKGINMLLFKNSSGKRYNSNSGSNNNSRTSYSSYYNNRRDDDGPRVAVLARRSSYDIALRDYTLPEVEEILDEIEGISDDYPVYRISDVHDIVGIQSEYTDNKYGWKSNVMPTYSHTRDGFMLHFPAPVLLESID